MAISQEIRVAEFWFLCSSLFHNVLYQCLEIQDDSFYNLEVMAQAKIQSKKNDMVQ